MKKIKPKVGQALYSLNVGNATNKYCPQKITEVIVKKVGRKYFFAGEKDSPSHTDNKYYIDTWKQHNNGYPATSKLFETKQEYLDKEESHRIIKKIREAFSVFTQNNITLETLRKIESLIDN